MDPCIKCFQTMSHSFRHARLDEIESEHKFTDCTSLYKLKNAYQFKNFTLSLKEAKGYKTINSVTMYVNSVQDVDLAEMKNNWGIW